MTVLPAASRQIKRHLIADVIRKRWRGMSYSFDIKSSVDLFAEFRLQVEEYRKDPVSSGKAVICAILSWHVVEWIYKEYSNALAAFATKRDFQEFVKTQCQSLSYMQDIANGSKHRGITKYEPTVKDTNMHQGAFSSAFSKAFDVSSLRIVLDGDVFVYFDEELDRVEAYLRDLFTNTLNANV